MSILAHLQKWHVEIPRFRQENSKWLHVNLENGTRKNNNKKNTCVKFSISYSHLLEMRGFAKSFFNVYRAACNL